MQFQTNRMSQSQDISETPNFGAKLGINGPKLGPKIFFSHYHFHQLDIMPVFHNIQNQENLISQTQETDQKPQIWANLGLIYPSLGQFSFLENRASSLFF